MARAHLTSEQKDAVLEAWLHSVEQRPASKDLPRATLVARVAPILDRIVEPDEAFPERLPSGRGLAQQRLVEGLALNELLAEYSLLRQHAVNEVSAADVPPSERTELLTDILQVVDAASDAATTEYEESTRYLQDAIENISLATLESVSLDDYLQRALTSFQHGNIDSAMIALREGDLLKPQTVVGLESSTLPPVKIGDGFVGQIAAERRPISVADLANDPRVLMRCWPRDQPVKAAYGIPILGPHEELEGVAVIGSTTAHDLSDRDRRAFAAIVRRIAWAITYWRLRNEVEIERASLQSLVGHLPAGVLMADSMGKIILHNSQFEAIWRRPFRPTETVGTFSRWPGFHGDGRPLRPDEWPIVRATTRGELVVNEEIELLRGDGSRATTLISSAPIRDQTGRLAGAVSVYVDTTRKKETERELRQLAAQAQHAEATQQLIADVGVVLFQADDAQTALDSFVDLLVPRQADFCSIHLLDEQGKAFAESAMRHVDASIAQRARKYLQPDPERGAVLQVIETRAPVVGAFEEIVKRFGLGERYVQELRTLSLEWLTLLPIIGRNRVLGVLLLSSSESRHDDDSQVLEILARRLSFAIDNLRLHAAARLAEAHFFGILSQSPDAIVSCDSEGRVLLFNASAQKIYGGPDTDVVGRSIDILVAERERSRLWTWMAESNGGEAPRLEVSSLRKSGEEFLAEVGVARLELGGRRLFTLFVRDLTQLKAAEAERERLLAAEHQRRVMLERLRESSLSVSAAEAAEHGGTSPVLQAVVDQARVLTNADFAAMGVGTDPDGPFDPCVWSDIALDKNAVIDRHPRLRGKLGAIVHLGQVVRITSMRAHPSFAVFAADHPDTEALLGVPVRLRGRSIGALFLSKRPGAGVFSDGDETIVSLLTGHAAIAVENAQLIERINAAVRVREGLLATVSHDLKNPLNAISLREQRLLMTSVDPELRGHAQAVRRAAGTMQWIIGGLLDAATLQEGHLKLAYDEHRLEDLLDEVLDLLDPIARQRSIKVVRPSAPVPPVRVDHARMIQVLSNLLGNAMKFSPDRGTITIAAQSGPEDLLVAVSDEGPGIPPDVMEHVFESYFTTGRTGTGLGLYIARGIVEAHGGRIWATSELGHGAKFHFTIPRSVPSDEARSNR
jgi:PAS domain S-box-containing protein